MPSTGTNGNEIELFAGSAEPVGRSLLLASAGPRAVAASLTSS